MWRGSKPLGIGPLGAAVPPPVILPLGIGSKYGDQPSELQYTTSSLAVWSFLVIHVLEVSRSTDLRRLSTRPQRRRHKAILTLV